MPSLTTLVCEEVAALARRPLSADVVAAARRSFLNVVGTAVGASRSAATDIVVRAAVGRGAAGRCPVPGRPELLDPLSAALATGVAAHVDDFDDTHLATVIHPGAASLAAALPVAVSEGLEGDALLRAFALGCEVQLRLGNAVSPSHYDLGWHITGTCGAVGAAVTAGVLYGLDAAGLESAVGIATLGTLGHRQAFGSMTKAFHPGKAAANGVLAALLARRGERGPSAALDRTGGFLSVLADETRPELLVDGFGSAWELNVNTFKPYPCGIVSHPVIDAALAAGARIDEVRRIRAIVIRCHPLVPELMGTIQPEDGLQGRFSAAHTAAASLADGQLTLRQFDDERVRLADVRRLRALVTFAPDPAVNRDEAELTVTLDDGSQITEHVRHARGSLARPLTDDELTAKVVRLVEDVSPGRGELVVEAARSVAQPGGLQRLLAAVTPEAGAEVGDFAAGERAPVGTRPGGRDGSAGHQDLPPTAAVAAFVLRAEVPERELERGADLVLRVLERAAAGAADPGLRPLARVAADEPGGPECPVPGSDDVLGAAWMAALTAASALARPLDGTESADAAWSHPAHVLPVVAAAIATGVRAGARLDAVARAVACGLEVGACLTDLLAESLRARGWGLAGTIGRVAAVTACGVLAGLDESTMASALGLAATQAAGIPNDPETEHLRVAMAAADAVQAASLAAHGYTASAGALEGRRGFVRLLTPEASPDVLDKLPGLLGAHWTSPAGPAPTDPSAASADRSAAVDPATPIVDIVRRQTPAAPGTRAGATAC